MQPISGGERRRAPYSVTFRLASESAKSLPRAPELFQRDIMYSATSRIVLLRQHI